MTLSHPIKSPRKLIEVALPLDAINAACAYEKMPGIGAHPRGIHLWWSRKPLAAARAILFAQLVNDPGTNSGRGFKYGVNKKAAAIERARLFKIIEDIAKWENTFNEEVLERARNEIRRSWREVCELNKDHPQAKELFNPDQLPAFHDPFSGGGAIPLEAQRLGLESFASDINPVAVLIGKALIEIPPKFAGATPVGPDRNLNKGRSLGIMRHWPGATGLAEDVRRYGAWMSGEATKRFGNLYPAAEITADITANRIDLKPLIGQKLTVLAWIWARTVRSPNPAFSHVEVPLVSTYILANKKGKEVYVQPIVDGDKYSFTVRTGTPPLNAEIGTKATKRGANFRCLISGAPISAEYIRQEAQSGRVGLRLMAVVAKVPRGRTYLPPTEAQEEIGRTASPNWKPEIEFFQDALGFRVGNYGMSKWSDLFSPRQLVALSGFSELVSTAHGKIRCDALAAGMPDDMRGLDSGGLGATAYADAVCVYLAFAVSRCADFVNSLCGWSPSNQKVMHLFGKQTLSMAWEFAEANILVETVGGFLPATEYISDCIKTLSPSGRGYSTQADAQTQKISRLKTISTDPPYYDNIGYADLSDFFYVWLRPILRSVYPTTLSTMVVPKAEELVATPSRHGGKGNAEAFFLEGMTQVIQNLAEQAHPEGPVTIYYAFKQSETSNVAGTSSPGWETFLTAVLKAGFAIVGTWPLRSEQEFRMRNMGSNALASSIVLVCRKRSPETSTISRREFIRELNGVLPDSLDEMTRGTDGGHSPVAPVDLSQAIIGPGMAVFSKYPAVLEADGTPMTVRTALQLINRFLAEDDFDSDTQFCLHWFEQYGWETGKFGEADTLARAKGTSVDGVKQAGVLHATGGNVRLLKWAEYPTDWDPKSDQRLPIWEVLHQLIRVFNTDGETGAAAVFAAVQSKVEAARQLAYRLYTLCERKNWAEDARAYNEVVTSWSGIESAASKEPAMKQGELFE
jgi:putative DNA methylase